jgi:hypothetical protein
LEEIHKSKNSYSSFTSPEYHQYDLILPSLDRINIRTIAEAKRNRAKRLGDEDYSRRKASGEKIKMADCEIDYKKMAKTDLVFRIMTYEHIPVNKTRKKSQKTEADGHDRVNFPPFQHWKFDEAGELICIGKSHWRGSVKSGRFSKDHGQITDKLARMYIMMCEKYAMKYNWRGYTYRDEMQNSAILQLTYVGLRFNEAKSANPFAYYTAAITNSFCRVLNTEKRNQNIRDDILEMNGLNPSWSRQGVGSNTPIFEE